MRFEVESPQAVTEVAFDLDTDGEPPIRVTFPVGVGFDGRFVRAMAFKPVINGTFPLIVTARTGLDMAETICRPGVTVIP